MNANAFANRPMASWSIVASSILQLPIEAVPEQVALHH
jgi:hypothetical protein